MKDELVIVLVEKIKNMKSGTETSISKLIGYNSLQKYESEEIFEIYKIVIEKCEKDNIVLNFEKYKDKTVGLPFNIPFIKKAILLLCGIINIHMKEDRLKCMIQKNMEIMVKRKRFS